MVFEVFQKLHLQTFIVFYHLVKKSKFDITDLSFTVYFPYSFSCQRVDVFLKFLKCLLFFFRVGQATITYKHGKERASFRCLVYFYILQRNNKMVEYKQNKVFPGCEKRVAMKAIQKKRKKNNPKNLQFKNCSLTFIFVCVFSNVS